MRKMLTFATVAFMTAALNAAQVSWSTEAENSQLFGANSSSGSVYIFALGDSAKTFGNAGFNIVDMTLTANDNTVYYRATLGNYQIRSDDSYWAEGELALVFENNSGDTQTSSPINQFWAVVTVDDMTTGFYGVDVFQVSGMNAMSPTFMVEGASSFDVAQYTTVPEPTSMALLALGVAAIGLRRKFRK